MYMHLYIFPEATGKRNAAQITIGKVRTQIYKRAVAFDGDNRFSAGLRKVSQGLLLVRQKAILPGSLAASLEHTIGGRKAYSQLSIRNNG